MSDPAARLRRHVPTGLYLSARFFAATDGLWSRLAGLESQIVQDAIEKVRICAPIYVAGVARAGTTMVTELLERHPYVTSHRYSDFPNVFTPYWRNWLAARMPRRSSEPAERAHRDRIMVTSESPEAVEEVIWTHFFPHVHQPGVCHVLDENTQRIGFERFYRDHIRKLLAVRGARRYLTKGNYNVARLGYILKLFPDARFVIPVRDPVRHVASLLKQDRLFTRMASEDSRVSLQLAMSGHFEFGPDKRCIHFGDDRAAAVIERDWRDDPVAGWARYWTHAYREVLAFADRDEAHCEAIEIVRYEDLCGRSGATIDRILEHCRLPEDSFVEIRREYIDRLSEPTYYDIGLSDSEVARIRSITAPVASRLGYACADD